MQRKNNGRGTLEQNGTERTRMVRNGTGWVVQYNGHSTEWKRILFMPPAVPLELIGSF